MNNTLKRGRPKGSFIGKYPISVNGKITRMFRKYDSMMGRCYRPTHAAYPHYAAKGIEVCERWRMRSERGKGHIGFQNFYDDMGECPPGLTLERIDNAKGYSPDNCRWATWKEQAANRVRSGTPRNPDSIAGRCRAAGLRYSMVIQRIRNGWTEAEAFSVRPL